MEIRNPEIETAATATATSIATAATKTDTQNILNMNVKQSQVQQIVFCVFPCQSMMITPTQAFRFVIYRCRRYC